MPLALRRATSTRGVSRIGVYHHLGSAINRISIGCSFQTRNNPHDLTTDSDQIDRFGRRERLAQFRIGRQGPLLSCSSVCENKRAAGSSFAPCFTDELSIAKSLRGKLVKLQFRVGNFTDSRCKITSFWSRSTNSYINPIDSGCLFRWAGGLGRCWLSNSPLDQVCSTTLYCTAVSSKL